jgi:DNA-binding transcriptional regulator YhcF (GntR family)
MNKERVPDSTEERNLADRFIINRIDSVPHLEALLLLWRSRSEEQASEIPQDRAAGNPPTGIWSAEQLAKRLWIAPDAARNILRELERDQLIVATARGEERYCYQSEPERDRALQAVETAYAREMIRISNMIHSKASAAVRDFARAFRFTKEQE